jgi:hypothetical protein
MPSEPICDRVMQEISTAHDEGRSLDSSAQAHIATCEQCTDFAADIGALDTALARGHYDQAPDLAPRVMAAIDGDPRRQWWSVAAVALVGLLAGGLVGSMSTRVDIGQASDLGELFHSTATDVDGLSANLIVVERGVHETVPERVYSGEIDYVAPEKLSIRLVDTTEYPTEDWLPNDVAFTISNGDIVTKSGSPCPVAALPNCLVEPMTTALGDQPPFDDGVLIPLEIVGPGRSLSRSSAFEILGTTELDEEPTIQVRSTVAAVELIGAMTDRGAWRELHPTDPVLMWLDEATLIPRRIEVFAADSPERELWQLRRGYEDAPEGETPIFIIELTNLVVGEGIVDLNLPDDAPSRGFVDGDASVAEPRLPAGFEPHRSGHWLLASGARVDTASWSDGRSWVMVEVTRQWDEPRLFGLSLPFVDPVDLGDGSVGYLSPAGDAVAIHGETDEILVTGSVSSGFLVETAASLGIQGLEVPSTWLEASTVAVEDLPEGTLVPDVTGWSLLGRIDGESTTVLLTGGGARSVIVTQVPGTRLDTPTGPDFSEVEIRGLAGRYDLSSSTLEWVEDGFVVRVKSNTVGLEELRELAEAMEPR